jgi:hypothetical protein
MIIIIFRNIISGFLDIIDSVLHSDTNMCGLDHRNVVLLISDRNRRAEGELKWQYLRLL